ncbi:MAG: hypothetical protein MUE59_15030, partial [Thiobacillaceae bacterium]|nr:hypothetical protein [Thiobacillaceae bacterium]
QTAVGERLRPAFGLAVAQRDVDLRRQRPQMARRHHPPQPPPTTTMRSPSPAARAVGGKAL